jgi:hypothetical protein
MPLLEVHRRFARQDVCLSQKHGISLAPRGHASELMQQRVGTRFQWLRDSGRIHQERRGIQPEARDAERQPEADGLPDSRACSSTR